MSAPPADAPVRIEAFAPPAGPLRAGDLAAAALTARNTADTAVRVWVGYSVQTPDRDWHDVEAAPLAIAAGASATARRAWPVPEGAAVGPHRVVMALWSAPPGTPGARRLASVDRPAAFEIGVPIPPSVVGGAWTAGDHALGRGRVRPALVTLGSGGGVRLALRGPDGAEVRGAERFTYGELRVRMRTPLAPGSLSAVFLYGEEGERSDEIDIELPNDGSRRALLTTWERGAQRRHTEVALPFDPSAAAHDYAIRWTAGALVLLADGAPLARWTSGYPRRPMHAMVNAWWPTWLTADPAAPADPHALVVDAITVTPAPER